MKHQAASNEETRDLLINANRLQPSASDDEEADFHSHTRPTMMTNDSLDSTGTKMLMPHEMGGDASLVGQHSIHHTYSDQLNHGASFYRHSSNSGGGFNGYHNSYHNNSYSNSTMITNNQTFSNLIHQQMNNNHSVPPPLIHQQTFKETAVAQVIKEEEVKDIPADEPPAEEEVPAANAEDENEEPEPEIDIVISNVVCAFSVKCPLALKDIALNGANVEYKRENGMVTMKLRKPYTTASIWSSGKITCTGATSEDQAKVAARRYARVLEKLNFRVRFNNYRVVNVLGTCRMPWAIKIVQFSEKYKKEASYEPELHPGVTYNLYNPTATLKIFSTGSMTVTARSVANVQAAIEHIYPLVYEFKKARSPKEPVQIEEELIVEDDEDSDFGFDPDPVNPVDPLNDEPPKKKQKVRDVSHLTKRFKGSRGAKRPPGKMNDPSEDLIYVSDCDDPDDF